MVESAHAVYRTPMLLRLAAAALVLALLVPPAATRPRPRRAKVTSLRPLIDAEWQHSEKGKRAKYYRLTRSGRRRLTAEQSKGEQLSAAMTRVLRPVD